MTVSSDFKEFEAVSVKDAIALAEKHFNATKDKLTIKIVCEESKGLFGMRGSKQAKIKAALK